MRIISRVTLVFPVLLPLTVACNFMQTSGGESTPRSHQEGKPVAQDKVLPIQDGETSRQEREVVSPQPIEAPRPGVPVDDRTYRELKERAKGR